MLTNCQAGTQDMPKKALWRLKLEEERAGIKSDEEIFGGMIVREGLQHANYPEAIAELSKMAEAIAQLAASHAVLTKLVTGWGGISNPNLDHATKSDLSVKNNPHPKVFCVKSAELPRKN